MPNYTLVLKNDKQKFYKRISLFIIIINGLFLLYLALFAETKKLQISSIVSLSLLSLFTAINFYFRNTIYKYSYHIYFFAFMMIWINAEVYWLAAAMLVFDILNHIATRELTVIISQNEVAYPSIINKRVSWDNLTNVILKDGLLTIDFKNDKILQQYIDEKSKLVNETDFNEFCQQQLNK